MRTLLLALLAATTALLTGAGCAHRTRPTSGVGSRQDFVVYVVNKSGTQSVPVTIYVDGVRVEDRIYAPFASTKDRGEIRLRLPRGAHDVRAVVANLTGQTEVDLDHFMCNVIYYDQTTDPKERGGIVPPKLIVEQIGWC
jgi:hypothetical protein